MLDDTWPPAMLMFLELPWLVICRLGIAGRAGIDFGSPPSNFSVNVALSATVMVSRSSVAVKVAPAPANGAQQTVKPRTETPLNRANIDRRRPGALNLNGDNIVGIDNLFSVAR